MGLVCAVGGQCLNAGYLTIQKTLDVINQKYQLRIPNNEVIHEFKELVSEHLHIDTSELLAIYESFKENDPSKFIKAYRDILLNVTSFHDLKDENSYQAPWPAVCILMLGICLYVKNEFELISNREEGKGRCDLILKAK